MKKQLLTLLTTASILFLTGCADPQTAGNDATDIVDTTQGESITESQSQDAGTTETADTDLETDTETSAEIAEPTTEQSMEEWLTEIGKQGTICMAVWNDTTSTKHIIENEETYERQDGDRFFMCTPSKVKENLSDSTIGHKLNKPSDNYLEVTLDDFLGEATICFDVICLDGEQGHIQFDLTYSGTTTSNPTTDAPYLPGLYWTMDLGLATPTIVVYNDTTNFKQILDEGATYQFCQGDELAVYLPDNYIYDSTNMGNDNLTLIVNVVWIDWTGVDLGNEFTFEFNAQNTDTLEKFTTQVTLLPIQ